MATRRYKVTPTVTAGAYSANDVVGALLTFGGLRNGVLQSITICDNAAQAVDYVLVLFESSPTNIADNATFDIADADLDKIIYQDTLTSADTRQAFTDNSYHFLYGLTAELWSAGGTVYGFLVTTGTPTYAATTDITVTLQVRDFDTVKSFRV
jgi:hypothetical protein|tara:strand:+ start:715 stop:1173 length:459 start_codon:yes stop_codon:yes gene_type:complete